MWRAFIHMYILASRCWGNYYLKIPYAKEKWIIMMIWEYKASRVHFCCSHTHTFYIHLCISGSVVAEFFHIYFFQKKNFSTHNRRLLARLHSQVRCRCGVYISDTGAKQTAREKKTHSKKLFWNEKSGMRRKQALTSTVVRCDDNAARKKNENIKLNERGAIKVEELDMNRCVWARELFCVNTKKYQIVEHAHLRLIVLRGDSSTGV